MIVTDCMAHKILIIANWSFTERRLTFELEKPL